MRRRIVSIAVSVFTTIILLFSTIQTEIVCAGTDKNVTIAGKVYEFEEKNHYEYSNSDSFAQATLLSMPLK